MIEIIKGAFFAEFESRSMHKPASVDRTGEYERGYRSGAEIRELRSNEEIAAFVRKAKARSQFDRGFLAGLKGEPL